MQACHGVTGNNPRGFTEQIAVILYHSKFTSSQASQNLFIPYGATPYAVRHRKLVFSCSHLSVLLLHLSTNMWYCVSRNSSTVLVAEVSAESGKTCSKSLSPTCSKELPQTHISSSKSSMFCLDG